MASDEAIPPRKLWVAILQHDGKAVDAFPFPMEEEPSLAFVRKHINRIRRAAGEPLLGKTETIAIGRGPD
jgi:hypothetical protein